MSVRELTGFWWLPDDADTRLPGTLRIEGGGRAQLSLLGFFGEINEVLNCQSEIPLLLGAASGRRITLVECTQIASNISFPGTVTAKYQLRLCLLGAHVPTAGEILFESAEVSYTNLNEWVTISGFEHELSFGEESRPTSFSFRYAAPPAVEARVPGALLRITFGAQSQGSRLDQITLTEKVGVSVTPQTPLGFEDLLSSHLSLFQNFVTLGIGDSVSIRTANGILAEPRDRPSHQRWVEVVFEPTTLPDEGRRRSSHEMLFTYQDVADRFEPYLNTWFERSEVLNPVFNLYFATLFNPRMYLDQRFLNLAQAAESYHRRTSDRTILERETFSDLRRELCAVVDAKGYADESAATLKSKFNYINEIPLKERLRELLNSEEPLVRQLIPDPEGFVRLASDTRNYLTHYDDNLKDKAAEGFELYRLTEQLRFLLELLFLREIGFSAAERTSLVGRHQRYAHQRRYFFGQ